MKIKTPFRKKAPPIAINNQQPQQNLEQDKINQLEATIGEYRRALTLIAHDIDAFEAEFEDEEVGILTKPTFNLIKKLMPELVN